MSARKFFCPIVLVLVVSARQALAAPTDKQPSNAQPPQTAASAISQIAQALMIGIPTTGPVHVVSTPLSVSPPSSKANDLSVRIASQVAAAIGSRASYTQRVVEPASARSLHPKRHSLVVLSPSIANGLLTVRASVFTTRATIWDIAHKRALPPTAQPFGTARLDAEVQSFLTPLPIVGTTPTRFPHPTQDVLGLHCGDYDVDGALDLLIVSRRNLQVGHIRAGHWRSDRSMPWAQLSPLAPTPWREPFASIAMAGPGLIDVGLTDRANAVRLNHDLGKVETLRGFPLSLGQHSICTHRDIDSLEPRLLDCTLTQPDAHVELPASFDVFASSSLVASNGSTSLVYGVRDLDGTLHLHHDTRTAQLRSIGAQVALTDLDLDGQIDVIASKNVLDPEKDALTVWSWQGTTDPTVRWTLSVPAGIRAVTTCPTDAHRPKRIIVATESELWVWN